MKALRRWLRAWPAFGLALLIEASATDSAELKRPTALSWGCIEHAVSGKEIVADEQFDLHGRLNRVVVHLDDDIHMLIVTPDTSGECKLELNTRVDSRTLTTGRQVVAVRTVEMIELTGDTSPELHLWLEKKGGGGGPREDLSLHALYMRVDDDWRELMTFGQCLAFSAFELRPRPGERIPDIYLDEDRHCEPPFPGSRTYSVLRWNGVDLATVENGRIDRSASDWLAFAVIGCLLPVILGTAIWVAYKAFSSSLTSTQKSHARVVGVAFRSPRR
jgi:hypothetical protein